MITGEDIWKKRNTLPRPKKMFEFAAGLSDFPLRTTAAAKYDFSANKLILQIWKKWK